jgi:hypothetical protein
VRCRKVPAGLVKVLAVEVLLGGVADGLVRVAADDEPLA